MQQTPVSNSRQNLRNSLNKGIPGGKKKVSVQTSATGSQMKRYGSKEPATGADDDYENEGFDDNVVIEEKEKDDKIHGKRKIITGAPKVNVS